MMAAQGDQGSVSVGDFKFIINADRATDGEILVPGSVVTVSLNELFQISKYKESKEQAFNGAVNRSLGGDRADQQTVHMPTRILHVVLRCLTNERFLKVLEECRSGRIKESLEKEIADIGIETEGLVLDIENIQEVEEKAAAITIW